jgi:hypothetical protein
LRTFVVVRARTDCEPPARPLATCRACPRCDSCPDRIIPTTRVPIMTMTQLRALSRGMQARSAARPGCGRARRPSVLLAKGDDTPCVVSSVDDRSGMRHGPAGSACRILRTSACTAHGWCASTGSVSCSRTSRSWNVHGCVLAPCPKGNIWEGSARGLGMSYLSPRFQPCQTETDGERS